MLQGALTTEDASTSCSGISIRQNYCANIISCDAVICFLLLRCVLCCYMNWWRGKVELQLCSLGIICGALPSSSSWLYRLLLCTSTCFSGQTLFFKITCVFIFLSLFFFLGIYLCPFCSLFHFQYCQLAPLLCCTIPP